MERSNLIKDLTDFVEKASHTSVMSNPLQDCIQELKGILLKHLEQQELLQRKLENKS